MKNKYLLILFLITVLPAIFLRDYTPSNELRYLAIADEALKNGNIFAFTLNGEWYSDKPPLYLWLLMGGRFLFGEHLRWFIFILSVIPAMGIMVIMDRWVKDEISLAYRSSSMLVLMTTVLFLGASVTARMDMLFSFFIVLSLYYFYILYRSKGYEERASWLFPLFMFLAVFTKGPYGFLIPFLSTTFFLLFTGGIKRFFTFWGKRTWIVLLGSCGVWFIAAWIEGGNEYISALLFHQTFGRAVHAFHHQEPFYYYLLTYWYSFLPWSFMLIAIFIAGLYRKLIRSTLQLFFLCVIVTSFILMSVISSKLAIYMLPLFPFIIYLILSIMPAFPWNKWIALSLGIPYGVLIFTLPMYHYMMKVPRFEYLSQFWFYSAATILSLSAAVALVCLYYRKKMRISVNIMALGILCSVFIGSWAIPRINSHIGYKELCERGLLLSQEKKANGFCVYKVGRSEGMSVFLSSSPKEVSIEEILTNKCKGKILFLSLKEFNSSEKLRSIVEKKNPEVIGEYIVVKL